MRKLLLILSLVAANWVQAQVLPTFGNSRTGGSGMQFLKIMPDARGAALGGAAAGISSDPSAMFWNPAGITRGDTGKLDILLSHTSYYANANLNYLGITFKPGKYSHFGLQVSSLNYDEMEETTEFQPTGTGRTVNVSSTLIGLTYARILTENFSFGVNAKWAHEGIADVAVNNVLFDLGLTYYIGLMNSKFGVSFSNFGVNVAPSGEVSLLKMNGEQTINSFTEISVPSAFRFGGSFDPISKGAHRLMVAAQLSHPTDNNETFALGTEYSWKNILFGRAGYEFGSDENYRMPTVGAGIKLRKRNGTYRFDYGFSAKERLGNHHRLTLGICIL
jgi:hypothetical protein